MVFGSNAIIRGVVAIAAAELVTDFLLSVHCIWLQLIMFLGCVD